MVQVSINCKINIAAIHRKTRGTGELIQDSLLYACKQHSTNHQLEE